MGGQCFKHPSQNVPTVVDDFSRACLPLVVDNSLSGIRIARELDEIAKLRGAPGRMKLRIVRADALGW